MSEGRADRTARLTTQLGGSSASSSQDYVRLAYLLYAQSASYARSVDGNCSIYTLAGIPTLFSALRALLIEGNCGMYGAGRNTECLATLAKTATEVSFLAEHYKAPEPLRKRLALLYEVRNEIVHPAHTPTGTRHGTPEYLVHLRKAGLLQSTNSEESDCTWIAQLQSHRLFGYTFAAAGIAAYCEPENKVSLGFVEGLNILI